MCRVRYATRQGPRLTVGRTLLTFLPYILLAACYTLEAGLHISLLYTRCMISRPPVITFSFWKASHLSTSI